MTFSVTWDASFEGLPTDANYMYEVDNYIRELKGAISERMEVDHIWKVGATDGTHKKLTLAQIADPTLAANTLYLYAKDASAKIELFVMDEDGDTIQLTSGGKIASFPAGTKMWFYQNTAPSGWTYDSTPADAVLAVKGGSNAFNANGGTQAGSWTHLHSLNAHTHTGPSHTHELPFGTVALGYELRMNEASLSATDESFTSRVTGSADYPGAQTRKRMVSYAGGTGASGAPSVTDTLGAKTLTGDTAGTWRPLAQIGIICTKD